MKHTQIYKEAIDVIPGGVNSPVRAFKAVGGQPIFAKKGKGSFFWDEQGKKYLDLCGSWGALLFGHAPSSLLKTLVREMKNGTSFGIATQKEVELAQAIRLLYPSMEMLRLVSSGTEAVMSAVRLARGFTGRTKIVKIDGGYHGHVDSLLVKAGSGAATFGVPDSAGIPEALAKETLSISFNDTRALEHVFLRQGKEIAALILEPVPANMGVIPPKAEYLDSCRRLTKHYGSLLIFDEVITGFRVSAGGAQALFDLKPDLTCMGKILGSGFPIAAFGGRKEIMQKLAPLGPVYQAGTLSGNPVAVTAALWVLEKMMIKTKLAGTKKMVSITDKIAQKAEAFYRELRYEIEKNQWPLQLNTCASMFTLFFTRENVTDYTSAKSSDTQAFARFFQLCLAHGVYIAPSQFEANFISSEHSSGDLSHIRDVFCAALHAIYKK